MRVLTRFVLGIFACVVALNCYAPLILAQTDANDRLSLAVSPGMREVVLAPGEAKKVTIDVTNITTIALPIKATVGKFVTLEDVAPKDQAIFDVSQWFGVQEPDFILQPNQRKVVTVTITAPQNAEPGGHYATLYFQPLVPSQVLKQQGARVGARVGTLFFVIVKGDIAESLRIRSLKTVHVQQAGPVEFGLTIRNEGNVHIIPSGAIDVFDYRNRPIAQLPLPVSAILPHTEKTIRIPWDNKGKIGSFSAQATLKYGTPQQTHMSEKQRFWILPWLKSSLLIIVFFVAVLFVWRTHKRWRRAIQVLLKDKI